MEKEQLTNSKHLIVIGGSSGSLDALMIILPQLRKNFNTPIILVMHRTNASGTALAELLNTKTSLHVKEADEKDVLQPGWIYIAPAGYHLLVEADGTLSLDVSEKVNYCRPSIDVSFASAAVAYGSKLIAVLLSGANADGADGMKKVKQKGGYTIVQDPTEALVAYMPEQAILLSVVDKIAAAKKIGELLNEET